MTDRRQLAAAIHRQLAAVWAAGAAAAQLPGTDDPVEVAVRVATRQRVLDDAAGKILAAERKR